MHRDDASVGRGGDNEITMKFFPSTSILSSRGSSRVSDLTAPPPYSSIFFTSSTSDSTTTAKTAATTSAAATGNLSLLMLRHKDLLGRHQTCLSQLQKTFKEAETLRQENTNLRIANGDLNNRLNRLSEAYLQNQYASMMMPSPDPTSPLSPEYVTAPLSSITEKFGDLSVREKIRECASPWESCESPTSVMENDRSESNVDRVSLPKSISVRSTGFLKAAGQPTPTVTSAVPSRTTTRSHPAVPVDVPLKVHVHGGDKKNEPVELEVYNQGMTKTELCNKWQETGSCPYGDNCQFAHGFGELRPVIRHPRYKTEVCRMVLAGDPCPYGHRCHFRHALTEQEKLAIPLKLD